MGYKMRGRIGGFHLKFLMNFLNSIGKVEDLVCSSRNIKKEDMYVGCRETRGSGIDGNG